MEENRCIFLEKNVNVGFVLAVETSVKLWTTECDPSFMQAQFKQNIVVDLMY